MKRDRIERQLKESAEVISALASETADIGRICDVVVEALKQGRKILTAGNGGSAAEALHMAEELVGRFRSNRPSLAGVSLNADPTALTCIANDFGFDKVFSRQVEGLGREGDVLVLFSTSGRAANLREALDAARRKGMATICLLGRDGGPLAGGAQHEIIVKVDRTERIQEAHQVLLHLILDAVEQAYSDDKAS